MGNKVFISPAPLIHGTYQGVERDEEAMKTYWFGLFVSALLFSSCCYCCRDWIPRESDRIRVVELDRRTAENLMGNVGCEK